MSRIKQDASRLSQRMLVFLVEDVSLFMYAVSFVVGVVAFGVAYYLLTPSGHGIGQNLIPLSDITPLGGIYFSIVTVSSLGYGDMHPMGASKALACAEVLMGLAVIGIMIAKVTSQRLSYHVSRLFSSDAQRRLEKIAAEFETAQNRLAEITTELASIYQSTPVGTSNGDKAPLLSNFREVIGTLHAKCVGFRDYFSDETAQSNYFRIAPVNAVVRVGDIVDKVFFRLGQFIISLSPQSRTEILDSHNRQRISEAIDSQKQVCSMVRQYATDGEILAAFQRIEETCKQLPASYFAVPQELQPDQVLQGTDEPQQSSGTDDGRGDSP